MRRLYRLQSVFRGCAYFFFLIFSLYSLFLDSVLRPFWIAMFRGMRRPLASCEHGPSACGGQSQWPGTAWHSLAQPAAGFPNLRQHFSLHMLAERVLQSLTQVMWRWRAASQLFLKLLLILGARGSSINNAASITRKNALAKHETRLVDDLASP